MTLNLPSLNERSRERYATPKHAITPAVLTKDERKKSREAQGEAFREAVWKRDKGKSRATGKKLAKSGTDWDTVGEVDHVINRSIAPDRIYDVTNGLLLSKRENRLKKTACPLAPEYHLFEVTGPDDRGQPQTFTWRDKDGTIRKQRSG